MYVSMQIHEWQHNYLGQEKIVVELIQITYSRFARSQDRNKFAQQPHQLLCR